MGSSASNDSSGDNNRDWQGFLQQRSGDMERAYSRDSALVGYDPAIYGSAVKLEKQEAHKFELPFVLDDEFHSKVDQNAPVLHLSFRAKFLKEPKCEAAVYFWASERFSKEGEFKGVYSAQPLLIFKLTMGAPSFTFSMDLSSLSPSKIHSAGIESPIVIVLFNQEVGVQIIHRFSVNPSKDFQPEMTKRALLLNSEYIGLTPAFGLKNTPMFNKDAEEKCVICMCDPMQVMIEPCRHICMCETCAESLKGKSSQCPMCRGNITGFKLLFGS